MDNPDQNETTTNVELSTRNSFAITVALALLPQLAEQCTQRLLMPVRSIEVRQSKVTVHMGYGDRSTNTRLELELSQVEIIGSIHSCCFSGRVTDDLHSGASYRPFHGSFEHGDQGPKLSLQAVAA